MAKNQIISTGRWSCAAFYKLKTFEQKIVLEYLRSNPLTTRSGIYTIYSGNISTSLGEANGIKFFDQKTNQLKNFDAESVKQILFELQEMDAIDYDPIDHVVYIKNFHKEVPFGNGKPSIIAKELINEFNKAIKSKNSKLMGFWIDYASENLNELEKLEEKLTAKNSADDLSLQNIIDIGKLKE